MTQKWAASPPSMGEDTQTLHLRSSRPQMQAVWLARVVFPPATGNCLCNLAVEPWVPELWFPWTWKSFISFMYFLDLPPA